jgi:hypothetical protein
MYKMICSNQTNNLENTQKATRLDDLRVIAIDTLVPASKTSEARVRTKSHKESERSRSIYDVWCAAPLSIGLQVNSTLDTPRQTRKQDK